MRNLLKGRKAITLIALVITVVVLIILAGVLINISLGNNGLFNKAKTAKEMYTNAQDYEETEIAKITNRIKEYAVVSDRTNTPQNTENTMSGTEHFIGQYYFNGKPIYEKTIYISSLPNSSTATYYNHNIENVDAIWADHSNSFIDWKNGTTSSFPVMSSNDRSVVGITVNIGKSTFGIKTDTDRSSCSAYVTLRFTKTTDTATITTPITATSAN